MTKERDKKKQADRDLEHFLDGQRSAMEFVHDDLFHELVEVQATIAKALSILGDSKQFIERNNRIAAYKDVK